MLCGVKSLLQLSHHYCMRVFFILKLASKASKAKIAPQQSSARYRSLSKPLLSLISPPTQPNPFASRLRGELARAGIYLPKPQKATVRQKIRLESQPASELQQGLRSTPLAEERHHQRHNQRDGMTKPNLLHRVVNGARPDPG